MIGNVALGVQQVMISGGIDVSFPAFVVIAMSLVVCAMVDWGVSDRGAGALPDGDAGDGGHGTGSAERAGRHHHMAALGVALIAWRSNGLLLTCMAFGLQLMLTGTSACASNLLRAVLVGTHPTGGRGNVLGAALAVISLGVLSSGFQVIGSRTT